VSEPAWQQAVAYAATGRRYTELDGRSGPDLDALTAFLRSRLGVDLELSELAQPHPLPEDLRGGIGAAQVWAAVVELRARLAPPATGATTVLRSGALTAEERRLVEDVPPHHGS
jgi:hypothetical protein